MMNEILNSWISSVDWHGRLMVVKDAGLRFLITLAVSYVAGKAAGKIVLMIARRSADNDLIPFNKSLLKKDVYKRMTMMLPFIILYVSSEFIFSDIPKFGMILDKLIFSILVVMSLYAFSAFLDALDHYYQEFEVSRKNPIKGYLQMIKIFLAITGIIVILSTVFNRSPWGILSGFGAMTALVILMFRDWILGLIASIQINANNLIVIGDTIEMEKYGVNGEVIDISLSTVKVKNWDNTISMIPAYSIISETFKNFHGIKESGGRRIKRVIYIDINSITLPDEKTLKRIQKLSLLKGTGELKEGRESIKAESQISACSENMLSFILRIIQGSIVKRNLWPNFLNQPAAASLCRYMFLQTLLILWSMNWQLQKYSSTSLPWCRSSGCGFFRILQGAIWRDFLSKTPVSI